MIVIGISGRKQSGKSTAGNFFISLFMSQLEICEKIYLDENGEIIVSDLFGDVAYAGHFDAQNHRSNNETVLKVFKRLDPIIRIYNFADTLKQDICMGILGLTYEQCYGSDEEKNTLTPLFWNDKQLTAREAMETIGTDIFRKMKDEVWVDSAINKVIKDQPDIALITDCRFPNEVGAIKDIDGQIIRLTRDPFNSQAKAEVALDESLYDWKNFNYILDNTNSPLIDQTTRLKSILEEILQLS